MISTAPDREEPSVIFSGLPEGFRLSAGTKKIRSWAVPTDKLDGLTIISPPAYEGDCKLLVMLFDGKEVRDMKTTMISIHAKPEGPLCR